MITKEIFTQLPIDLKGDYAFQKGSFVAHREYGFLKFALYKTDKFFVEIQMDIGTLKIQDIVIIEEDCVKKIYKQII